jgi:hypothetical protein
MLNFKVEVEDSPYGEVTKLICQLTSGDFLCRLDVLKNSKREVHLAIIHDKNVETGHILGMFLEAPAIRDLITVLQYNLKLIEDAANA